MRDPKRLEVLQRANELTILTYTATRGFPTSERNGLTVQMRRCAQSIGANIAEGCGRSTEPAFLAFLQNATGSATELAQHARSAQLVGIGVAEQLIAVEGMADRVRMMLAKLSASVRRRLKG